MLSVLCRCPTSRHLLPTGALSVRCLVRPVDTDNVAGGSARATALQHMSTWPERPSVGQLVRDLIQIRSAPAPALLLGSAGLLPFITPALLAVNSTSCPPAILHAQLLYGACILSFLGGVRWGAALWPHTGPSATWSHMVSSVGPSLLAWLAVLTPSHALATLLVAGGLAASGYTDITQTGYPGWFRGLRACLSVVAVFSLLVSLTCHARASWSPQHNTGDDPSVDK